MDKKQTKAKTPQPQKANKTSFKENNKAAEKWTIEAATEFFNEAYDLSTDSDYNTLTQIARYLNVYPSTFDYVVTKFPVLESIKKNVLLNVAENLIQDAISGTGNPTMSIFVLKNNHNWKDKTETDITSKGDKLSPMTPIEFFSNGDKDK